MNKAIAILIFAVLLLGVLIGYYYSYLFPQTRQLVNIDSGKPAEKQTPVPATIESSATIYVPAIDDKGNGVAMPLVVQKRAGYGETLIDINNLVFWFDTQQSIQTARDVAQNLTGVDISRINLVYMINTNASLVGGPSAGAALTIATIAALENKKLNSSVMITGTINPDGTVGQVGGILEKARAAKQLDAKLFLVPEGQGTETFLKPEETCTENKKFIYCETRYRQTTIDISQTAGIPVKEVSTIAEAEKYFFE